MYEQRRSSLHPHLRHARARRWERVRIGGSGGGRRARARLHRRQRRNGRLQLHSRHASGDSRAIYTGGERQDVRHRNDDSGTRDDRRQHSEHSTAERSSAAEQRSVAAAARGTVTPHDQERAEAPDTHGQHNETTSDDARRWTGEARRWALHSSGEGSAATEHCTRRRIRGGCVDSISQRMRRLRCV